MKTKVRIIFLPFSLAVFKNAANVYTYIDETRLKTSVLTSYLRQNKTGHIYSNTKKFNGINDM